MTLTIKTHNTKTHHITIEAEGSLLTVQACPILNEYMCGYPESKAIYHHTERKNAERTFNRYIKKYSKLQAGRGSKTQKGDTMKKTINFGKIDYRGIGRKDCPVTVEIEIRKKGGEKTFTIDPATKERICTGNETPVYYELSICGNIWNARKTDIYCGGQCLDTIAEYIKTPLFEEIYKYWKLYHLNGLHPECEHQEEAGWNDIAKREVVLHKFTLTPEAIHEKRKLEGMAIEAAKKGEPFRARIKERFILNLDHSITTHKKELPENMAQFYKLDRTEKKALGWLHENEHPEGILCKPCPVCGYKYGTAWKHREIPADVLERINTIIQDPAY